MPIQQMFLGIPSASGAVNGSVYFDGSGDWLNLDANTDLDLDGDFTVEGWTYVNRFGWTGDRQAFFGNNIAWTTNHAAILLCNSGTGIDLNTITLWSNTSRIASSQPVLILPDDGWTHIAVTRSGSNIRIFKNGVQAGSTVSSSTTFKFGTGITRIGNTYVGSTEEGLDGKISNLRVIKGTALYTSNFIPPSESLTNVTNTKLLCCQSDTDVTAKEVGTTITTTGNPQPSSKNPFTFNPLYSVDFDGTNDYLSIPASSDLNLDGEFTIEAWVKVDDDGWSGTRRTLIANNIGWTTNHFAISLMNSGNSVEENCITLWDYNANSGGSVASSYPERVETSDGWTHIAVTRDSSNNIRIFKNGTQAGSTYNSSNSYLFGTGETWIGQITMSNLAGAESIDGKISNLRIVKGQALYTSSFTPALSFTTTSQGAIESNVKLLCCNAITTAGGTITAHGGPTAESASGIGFTTGSINFTGGEKVLTTVNSSDFNFGSGDFTVEAWVYTSDISNKGVASLWNYNDSRRSWSVSGVNTNNEIRGMVSPDGAWATRTEIIGTLPPNQWNHVAFTRSSNTLYFFVNGTSQGTASYTGSVYNNTSDGVLVAGQGAVDDVNNSLEGSISNLRVVKGTALYTSNFTPPTSPLTSITNTKLLCCQSSTSTTATTVTPGSIIATGDVYVASGPFIPNYSIDFDGNDSLQLASTADLSPGTSDFTFECWLRPEAWGGSWETVYHNGVYDGFYVGKDDSQNFVVRASSNTSFIQQSSLPPIGQWTHIAVSRSGSTLKLFYNGVEKNSVSNSHNFTTAATGIGETTGPGEGVNAKISNLRFVKGTAVYTSAFTPSTERLKIITNTELLCCNGYSVTDSSITPTTINTNGNPSTYVGPF